jgi:DNA-binding transcriptional ArsR family regulator
MEQKLAIAALTALAQESRLDVFRLLVGRGPEGMPAGEIAERLGVQPATLSFHLAQLSHSKLVASRRQGRSIIYSADIATMKDVVSFLLHDCCSGHPELCGVAGDAASAKAPCCGPANSKIGTTG